MGAPRRCCWGPFDANEISKREREKIERTEITGGPPDGKFLLLLLLLLLLSVTGIASSNGVYRQQFVSK